MIDYATALAIARVAFTPIEECFLREVGKQTASAVASGLNKLRCLIGDLLVDSQINSPDEPAIDPSDNRFEEVAAKILLAASKTPEAFSGVLEQYRLVQQELRSVRSVGDIAASATDSASIVQNVVLAGTVHIDNRNEKQTSSGQSLTTAGQLSAAAQELLLAAVNGDGEVLRLQQLGGPVIQAGNRNFISSPNPREKAKWEAALAELVDRGLLSQPSGNGQIYRVTQAGYACADSSQSTNDG